MFTQQWLSHNLLTPGDRAPSKSYCKCCHPVAFASRFLITEKSGFFIDITELIQKLARGAARKSLRLRHRNPRFLARSSSQLLRLFGYRDQQDVWYKETHVSHKAV